MLLDDSLSICSEKPGLIHSNEYETTLLVMNAPASFPIAFTGCSDRIAVKSSGAYHFIRFADLEWISADGDYVHLHAGDSSCRTRLTMKAVERLLNPARFIFIHRSTCVNVDFISRISGRNDEVTLRNGQRLEISRACQSRVRDYLENAMHTAWNGTDIREVAPDDFPEPRGRLASVSSPK
ncbi:MAG: DNA-binding response regulator [Verrucomicrobia bacterium]|nr:DNA-binding response regulator [Verrucomicrobiota bacterium]